MKPINKKCVILSAELSTLDDKINRQRTTTMHGFLEKNKIPFKELIGFYKGHRESSVLIELTDKFDFKACQNIAEWYDQETILELDESRNAILCDVGFHFGTPIGKLKAISFKQAQKLDAWSYCPMNDQYYGVL